jgi:hypothetical protein
MKCHEAPEETPTVSEERLLQLSCFISQGNFFLQEKYLFINLSFSRCEIPINWFEKCMFIRRKMCWYLFFDRDWKNK